MHYDKTNGIYLHGSICVLFAFWFLIIPLSIGFFLIRLQKNTNIANQEYSTI